MQKETANAILKFMNRVDLKGHETIAFNACVEGLQRIALGTMVVVPAPVEPGDGDNDGDEKPGGSE